MMQQNVAILECVGFGRTAASFLNLKDMRVNAFDNDRFIIKIHFGLVIATFIWILGLVLYNF